MSYAPLCSPLHSQNQHLTPEASQRYQKGSLGSLKARRCMKQRTSIEMKLGSPMTFTDRSS